MPTAERTLRKQLREQRERRQKVKVRIRRSEKVLKVVQARIERTRQRIQARNNPGAKAAAALLSHVGKQETGYNDSVWLRKWEDQLPHDRLDWMIPSNPWCGFACIWAWWKGAHKLLPDGTVYTPNIVTWANRGEGFRRVDPYQAKAGDLVVFDFDGGGADHVGLALGPARNGLVPTVEGNTSPGSGGSQENGEGCWKRSRPVSAIAVVARPK